MTHTELVVAAWSIVGAFILGSVLHGVLTPVKSVLAGGLSSNGTENLHKGA